MKADQVSGQPTVGLLASRTGVQADRCGTTNGKACYRPAAHPKASTAVRAGSCGPAAVHPQRAAARATPAEIRDLLAVRETGAYACEPAKGRPRRHVAETARRSSGCRRCWHSC
jgi:hypothetical protein